MKNVIIEKNGVEILWVENGYLNDSNDSLPIPAGESTFKMVIDWLNAVDPEGAIDPDTVALHVEHSDGWWRISAGSRPRPALWRT